MSLYANRLNWLLMLGLLALYASSTGQDQSVSIGGVVRGVAVHDGTIYLAQRDAIIILDARDPKRIHEVARYRRIRQFIDSMAMRWPVIFYVWHEPGVYYHHLASLDITDPAHPRPIHLLDISPAKSISVMTSGTNLIVHSRRVSLYDLANPLQPISRSLDPDTEKAISRIEPRDERAFPAIPAEVLYTGDIQAAKALGNRLFVRNAQGRVDQFDITDPLQPNFLETVDRTHAPVMEQGREARRASFLIQNKYRVCIITPVSESDPRNLVLQDVSDTTHPKTLHNLACGFSLSVGGAAIREFWMTGNLLVVALQTERNTAMTLLEVSLFDLADPTKPRMLGEFEGFDHIPEQVTASGNKVLFAERENGLRIDTLDFK